MMRTARAVLIVGIALGVGFCLGWTDRRPRTTPSAPATAESGAPPSLRVAVGAGVRLHIPAESGPPIPLDFGR